MSAPYRDYYYEHDGPWLRYRVTVPEDEDIKSWPPPGPYWITGYTDEDRKVVVGYLPYGVDSIRDGEPRDPIHHVRDQWDVAEADFIQERDEIGFSDRFPCPEWWEAEENRPTEGAFSTSGRPLSVVIQRSEVRRYSDEARVRFPVYYTGKVGVVRLDAETHDYPRADRRRVSKFVKTEAYADSRFEENARIRVSRLSTGDLTDAEFMAIQRTEEGDNSVTEDDFIRELRAARAIIDERTQDV